MTDQQQPEAPTPAHNQPANEPLIAPNFGDLLKILEPYMPLLTKITEVVGTQQERSSILTTWLLAGIVTVLSVLAGIAIVLDHVDTAEKIVIALVSFLGGTAMFGGGTKK